MKLSRYVQAICLAIVSFASSQSFAAVYSWSARFDAYTRTGDSPAAACSAAIAAYNAAAANRANSLVSVAPVANQPNQFICTWADKNGYSGQGYTFGAFRSGDSCPNPLQQPDPQTGVCKYNDPLNCAAKKGQNTTWTKEFASKEAYDANPIYCTTSQDGCALDVCSEVGSLECGTDGKTGKFGCWGGGTYNGDPQQASNGGNVDGCEGPECVPPPPQSSSSSQNCTPATTTNGVTSHTCVSESNKNQFADSNCAVGNVNGVQGLHCTNPDYVPESKDTTKTDKTDVTNNPDGGKTTTTESKTDTTKCKAGNCSSSSTTNTSTSTTDGNGNQTGGSTECKGDHCDDPSTPGKDESQEEEEEEGEEVERLVSGDACSASLSCEGDAIDCAILRQQKAMRCSMDWDTQKGSVLAEAGKAEYQLQEAEVDVSSLFSGASAGRWLGSSCPADRTVYLHSIGKSISISWSPICQYASYMGYLFVFSASLFFAHYVGRAFGGN